ATPAQLDAALGAVLGAGAVRVGEVIGRPDDGEGAIGSERARGGRHVGALLLPRPWRGIVAVGRRIGDVRMTRSRPQQVAEECRQTSSVSHSDLLPFDSLARRKAAPDLEALDTV